MLSPTLALFARISKPLWLNRLSVPQEQRWQVDNFTLHEWRRSSLHGLQSQDQDRDQDSRVPRPRPRPRLEGSKTKTKTKTLRFQGQDRDWDSRIPRPRPRPRLWGSKTKTETKTCKNGSRDVSRPRLKPRELQVCNYVYSSKAMEESVGFYTSLSWCHFRSDPVIQGTLDMHCCQAKEA